MHFMESSMWIVYQLDRLLMCWLHSQERCSIPALEWVLVWCLVLSRFPNNASTLHHSIRCRRAILDIVSFVPATNHKKDELLFVNSPWKHKPMRESALLMRRDTECNMLDIHMDTSNGAYFEIGFIWHINVALSSIRFRCWTFTQFVRFWVEASTPRSFRWLRIDAVVIIFCRTNMLWRSFAWRRLCHFHFALLFMSCLMQNTWTERVCSVSRT